MNQMQSGSRRVVKELIANGAAGWLIVCTLALVLSYQHHQADAQSSDSGRRDSFGDPILLNNNEASNAGDNSAGDLIWQPLRASSNLRSSFRPLNANLSPQPPPPPPPPSTPNAPEPPLPPSPPSLPEALALIRGEARRPAENTFSANNNNNNDARLESLFSQPANLVTSTFNLLSTTTTTTTPSPQPATTLAFEEDDQPTRQPMNRFRPTRAPADDNDSSGSGVGSRTGSRNGSNNNGRNNNPPSESMAPQPEIINGGPSLARDASFGGGGGDSSAAAAAAAPSSNSTTNYQINNECFECICEASTNCNAQSRCQTSDVRHTRCGLFLISYDQWLASGLSKQLVTREALARDVAADERAYYECVISRDCAEQLISAYMASQAIDCDRDGRINCYDVAAIHQAGPDKCSSEAMLESQFWSDFNACYGFARRR